MGPDVRCYTPTCRKPGRHLHGHGWHCDDCCHRTHNPPSAERVMLWWALMYGGFFITAICGYQLGAEALQPMTPGRFWQLMSLTVGGVGVMCVGWHWHRKDTET